MKLRVLPSTNAPDPGRVADQLIRHFPEAIERAREEDDQADESPLTTCEVCGGSGSDPWESFLQCPGCDGVGVVEE